ncbi:hypothetical protein PENNAL_c0255G12030 [Penicillium nalgiovense]|nr:hypothetical protein PENNAL_c0255G12030 [Penicillium nalgiovense]
MARSTIEEPHGPGLLGGALAEKDLQCDSPPPNEDAIQGSRLHTSDFIQSLSEFLDDPKNEEVMRWSEDGRSVFIAPESKFPAHRLAKLSTKSYRSFVRRLYYHGFHKIEGAYYHDSFTRGQPSSIRPTLEMSHSPSLPSPIRENNSQRGPRYKIIKRKRTRESG